MLVSHRYRFIYLKTLKTAGTSIEIALEPLCWPEGTYPGERHATEEVVSSAGIVGMRMQTVWSTWYNHMPAVEIRQHAPDAWRDYFKFCAIRNPFDKVVSMFWWQLDHASRKHFALATFDEVKIHFEKFVATSDLAFDRDKYMIDGCICVDKMIRFEHLEDDFAEVCRAIGIDAPPLGNYKRDTRLRPEPFAAYYSPETAAKVERVYDWELEHLGYRL